MGSVATPDLGHVHTTQNFCLFCEKLRQQEAVSSANDVFSPSKITQLSSNFKGAVKNIWRPTIFCQATKSFVPCQLSLRRVILFREHDYEKFLLVIRKNSHVSDATKVAKTKKL